MKPNLAARAVATILAREAGSGYGDGRSAEQGVNALRAERVTEVPANVWPLRADQPASGGWRHAITGRMRTALRAVALEAPQYSLARPENGA